MNNQPTFVLVRAMNFLLQKRKHRAEVWTVEKEFSGKNNYFPNIFEQVKESTFLVFGRVRKAYSMVSVLTGLVCF